MIFINMLNINIVLKSISEIDAELSRLFKTEIEDYPVFFKNFELFGNKPGAVSLRSGIYVHEKTANLYNVIYTYDYTVEYIFNKGEDIQKKAREYGYTHMFARSKYEKIKVVKYRLKEVDIDIYNSVLNKMIELELKEEM